MKIQIKSCSDALFWYNKRIGEVFEIYRIVDEYWVRTGDYYNTTNFVLFKDADVLQSSAEVQKAEVCND